MHTVRIENTDGDTVQAKVGDVVCFKSDVEQCGRIKKINRDPLGGYILLLEPLNDEGFEGGYIGGQHLTTMHPRDCWIEE